MVPVVTWRPPRALQWGCILVGSVHAAVCPPVEVTFIVNAADQDFPWDESIRRFWMNLNYKGEMDGVTWERRMQSAVRLIIEALAAGGDVLVHCRQGKHRSGILNIIVQTVCSKRTVVAGPRSLMRRSSGISRRIRWPRLSTPSKGSP